MPTEPQPADPDTIQAIAQTGIDLAQEGLDAHQRFLRETEESARAAARGELGQYIQELADRERAAATADE